MRKKMLALMALVLYTVLVVLATQRHTVNLLATNVANWEAVGAGTEYALGFRSGIELATADIQKHKWPSEARVYWTGPGVGMGVWR